ncbi:MAG: two-component regulator propeller domain-containing protein [Paludibacteraceae bacterium]|nr:two-component regulator propeller domain-containing protein [Paludibacteraceae bacterium]
MLKRTLLACACLIAACTASFAANTWVNYSTSNVSAFSGNSICGMGQDSSGVYWMDNGGGSILSFDGTTWTTQKTYVNTSYSVYVDPANVKWFGTMDLLYKYDNSTWTLYNLSNLIPGLPSSPYVVAIVPQKDTLWLGCTNGGLIKKVGDSYTWYHKTNTTMPSDSVSCLAIDKKGNKWVGYSGKYNASLVGHGISKFDGSTWTNYNKAGGYLPSDAIYGVATDASGNVWIATYAGLVKYDGTTWTTYTTSNSGLADNNVLTIAVDKNNCVWVGTSDKGVCKFDGTTWTNYTKSNTSGGLANVGVGVFIYVDKQNKKWFSAASISVLTEGNGSGINEVKAESLSIYPNPTADELQLSTAKAGILTITNLSGAEVLQQTVAANATVSVAMLPQGVYILHWTDGNSQKVAKLVKR